MEDTYPRTVLPGYLRLSTWVAVRELGLQRWLLWCTCCQMERGQLLKNILTWCSLTPHPRQKDQLTNTLGNQVARFPYYTTFLQPAAHLEYVQSSVGRFWNFWKFTCCSRLELHFREVKVCLPPYFELSREIKFSVISISTSIATSQHLMVRPVAVIS